MSLPRLLQSPQALRQGFGDGLRRMLDEPALGAYILALANANFEPRLYAELRADLYAALARQSRALAAAYADGGVERLPPDDVAVFERLQQTGLDALEAVSFRRAGPWELQFNPLRALRPPRAAHAVVEQLSAPFNPAGFHFNRAFLRREAIWAGTLGGRQVDLLYNKFPFAPQHALLVPERERELPQWLDAETHTYVWEVCERLGETLEGVAFGYNAYGAQASVNHLHLQMFLRPQPLPVELTQWRHCGGHAEYPLACAVFERMAEAYEFIDSLHRRNTTYNLLYRPGRVYCLPRQMQGHYTPASWAGGYAWYEACGGAVLSEAAAFAELDAAALSAELAKLRL